MHREFNLISNSRYLTPRTGCVIMDRSFLEEHSKNLPAKLPIAKEFLCER